MYVYTYVISLNTADLIFIIPEIVTLQFQQLCLRFEVPHFYNHLTSVNFCQSLSIEWILTVVLSSTPLIAGVVENLCLDLLVISTEILFCELSTNRFCPIFCSQSLYILHINPLSAQLLLNTHDNDIISVTHLLPLFILFFISKEISILVQTNPSTLSHMNQP